MISNDPLILHLNCIKQAIYSEVKLNFFKNPSIVCWPGHDMLLECFLLNEAPIVLLSVAPVCKYAFFVSL